MLLIVLVALHAEFPGKLKAQTGPLRFIRTEQVTPDAHFLTAGFIRVGYVPATNNLIVTFAGEFTETIDGLSGGYAYKEYTLDMQATGEYGALHSVSGDIGGRMVDNVFLL